jgi:hypothetical protein
MTYPRRYIDLNMSRIETVAGNGLLDRRALLRRGVAFAGALGTVVGLRATGAAAEPLVEAPWSLAPGDPVPAYQLPSKFAKNVVRAAVRTLSNPDFTAFQAGESWASEGEHETRHRVWFGRTNRSDTVWTHPSKMVD